jgi:hypothetical protein
VYGEETAAAVEALQEDLGVTVMAASARRR